MDWASLAQQWIQMKEVNETVVAPLMPQNAHTFSAEHVGGVAGGEAEMDVEKDDEKSNNPVEGMSRVLKVKL